MLATDLRLEAGRRKHDRTDHESTCTQAGEATWNLSAIYDEQSADTLPFLYTPASHVCVSASAGSVPFKYR